MAKYEVDRTAHSDGRQPDNNIVLFRYADVLLMKAEAKVRNGENGDTELNAVRQRVGMPFRQAYDQRIPSDAESNGHTTVFPIPQKYLDLNPQEKQHIGYK